MEKIVAGVVVVTGVSLWITVQWGAEWAASLAAVGMFMLIGGAVLLRGGR